jgi:DNA polymerase III delta subunit
MNETAAAPAQFVLFVGDDVISREAAREQFVLQVKQKGGDVVSSYFDSSSEPMAAFLSRFVTVSLFPETRIFQVRHANGLSDADLKELGQYLDHDVPDAYLVVEADVTKGEKKGARFTAWTKDFHARAKKQPARFAHFEFAKPPDYAVAKWVIENTRRLLNRSITESDAEYLVDLVGTDLGPLYSELQKMDLVLAPGKGIDRKTVEHISGSSRSMAPYELAQALGKKDLPRALEVVDNLFSGTFHAPLAISAIYRHFWQLFRIRAFAQRYPDEIRAFMGAVTRRNRPMQDEIGVKIGIAAGILSEGQANRIYPAIIKSGIIDQAKAFKDEHIRAIFRMLGKVDIDMKTGRADASRQTMQMLCYRIAKVAEIGAA